MKRTYIVGDTPILHNGERLPPGSSIALTFEELRSLGLSLQELPQPAAVFPPLYPPVPESVLVITSYSIHYTKLYDACQAGPQLTARAGDGLCTASALLLV